MQHLTNEQLEYILEGGDLGYNKANRMAGKLTNLTGKKYHIERCSWQGLVGGADWWEVRRSCLGFFYYTVAAFHLLDGERLSPEIEGLGFFEKS